MQVLLQFFNAPRVIFSIKTQPKVLMQRLLPLFNAQRMGFKNNLTALFGNIYLYLLGNIFI